MANIDIASPGGNEASLNAAMRARAAFGITFTGTSLSSNATIIFGDFQPHIPNLITLDLSSLAALVGNFNIFGMTLLTTLNLSSLATLAGDFTPSGMTSLPALDLSALATLAGDVGLSGMTSLTTLTITSALKSVGGNFNMFGCALNQASVDSILVRLAALDGTGGTTSYDGHTVNLGGGTNATPSATGLTAKATLEGRGNTVTVN